ncbi:hypothetical protein [Flavobacterium hercynium]|uniref:DUF304 domain-containing protein n=1 Tax=Flavobacterium hercynium TaxID=387094 RepID=A0A226GMD4_9FLAO|nr:hypothetical protein [Flavobacterium hercynium]OXA83183.1 hypothetical protein B0A66_22515 [Flavobacterium hercynium]SMP37259.1 hypothetical protein SAMN06265346_1298 [Flavobacterium hercynium]
MKEFKKFIQNGNQYTMKRQYGFGFVVVGGMAAISLTAFFMKEATVGWVFAGLAVLCFIAVWFEHVSINMDDKVIITKMGWINKPVSIPLADFISFELVKVSYNFIPTNVCLNMYYWKDGKEKCAGIAQGFTTRSIQNVINEIEEIIHVDEHS